MEQAATSYMRWKDIRAAHVKRAGGEEVIEIGKQELLASVRGHRLAELRRGYGLTQQDIAEKMGVTKGRISQIEQGKSQGKTFLPDMPQLLAGDFTNLSILKTET